MKLVDVYSSDKAPFILYELMKEREPHVNISHKTLPSWQEHLVFFNSRPYDAWYLIAKESGSVVGSIYLTINREVGMFIFRLHRGEGHGAAALQMLRSIHPGKLLANINPANVRSQAFFERNGFKMIQQTYASE